MCQSFGSNFALLCAREARAKEIRLASLLSQKESMFAIYYQGAPESGSLRFSWSPNLPKVERLAAVLPVIKSYCEANGLDLCGEQQLIRKMIEVYREGVQEFQLKINNQVAHGHMIAPLDQQYRPIRGRFPRATLKSIIESNPQGMSNRVQGHNHEKSGTGRGARRGASSEARLGG